MIRVTENSLRLQLAQLTRTHRFDASLRPHWDERRCFNDAVRSPQPSAPRFCVTILCEKFKHAGTVGEGDGFRQPPWLPFAQQSERHECRTHFATLETEIETPVSSFAGSYNDKVLSGRHPCASTDQNQSSFKNIPAVRLSAIAPRENSPTCFSPRAIKKRSLITSPLRRL